MKEYKNLSNGTSDGIILFYMKDGKIKPIGLTEKQAEMLDLTISLPFASNAMQVFSNDINIKNGVVK